MNSSISSLQQKLHHAVVWIIVTTLLFTISACSLPDRPYDVFVSTSGNDSNNCLSLSRPCLTIQAGINKSSAGSLLHIGSGTYTTNSGIVVNKLVTLQGAGQTQTIINSTFADGPAIAIGDPILNSIIVTTISKMTITADFHAIELTSHNSHLIGSSLTLMSARAIDLKNDSGGKVDLTNSSLTNAAYGIVNNGIFNGENLTIEGISRSGILNYGIMDLQNSTIRNVTDSQAAIRNVSVSNAADGTRIAHLTFNKGTISDNSGSGLLNDDQSIAEISSTTVSGNQQDGLHNIGSLYLDNVVVENNRSAGVNSQAGSMKVSKSAFVNNGTGIQLNNTTARITNSTITGNTTDGINASASRVLISFVTDAFNTKGFTYTTSTVSMDNTIIALNTESDCLFAASPFSRSSGNLACDPALTNSTLRLGSLTREAGTKVLPLQRRSIAIDLAAGDCPADDQRGYSRPNGAACDIGAFEFGSSMALTMATPGSVTPEVLELLPTETITPVKSAEPGVTPTATVVVPPTFTLKQNAFCRKGPDKSFSDVTAIPSGDTVEILNISGDGFWYYIHWKKFDAKCWVAALSGDASGDVTGLTVLNSPTLPAAKPAEPKLSPEPSAPPAPCNPLIRSCP